MTLFIYTDEVSSINDFINGSNSSMKLYANPFSETAYIGFELKTSAVLKLEVFNVLGE
jgi:hypothetical protein